PRWGLRLTLPTRSASTADHNPRPSDQAEQGRRERGVLCTRATEDAAMRRSDGRGAEALEGGGDTRNALIGPVGRDRREGEAEAVLAALDREVGAGDEGDAIGFRLGQQGNRVGGGGEV